MKQIGIGGSIYSDRNGLNSELGFQVTFAYHLNLSRLKNVVRRISFGSSLCGFQHSVDESRFEPYEFDPAVTGTVQSKFSVNANTGISIVYDGFFAGFSAANLIPVIWTNNYQGLEPMTRRNYFFMAGYSIPLHKRMVLEPSAVFKTTEKKNSQIDINLKSSYVEKGYTIWLAFSFRRIIERARHQNISLMPVIGYETGSFSFGYAYDFGLSAIQAHNFGSHEFMIGYKFCKQRGCAHCPPSQKWK